MTSVADRILEHLVLSTVALIQIMETCHELTESQRADMSAAVDAMNAASTLIVSES